jgi:hypothetical protein
MATCTEGDCAEPAVVRLYIPWEEDRDVCLGHGRVWAQKEGVVADPLDEADGEMF